MKTILGLLFVFLWLSIADASLDTNLCEVVWESIGKSDLFSFADILIDIVLTPYNVVRVIMVVGGLFGGIWFGQKGGKTLYSVVSFVFAVGSVVSLLIDYGQ